MKLLKAVGAAITAVGEKPWPPHIAADRAFTAFVDTLSPFDFPILGDYVGDDAVGYEDDGYLMWPTDSSCDVAAGAEDQVQAGVDAPSAPAWLPKSSAAADSSSRPLGGTAEHHDAAAADPYPNHRLMCAAANGLALWIESGTCEQPTYWGSIVRELGK